MGILLHCLSAVPAHSLTYLKMFLSKSLMVVLAIMGIMLLQDATPEPQFWQGDILNIEGHGLQCTHIETPKDLRCLHGIGESPSIVDLQCLPHIHMKVNRYRPVEWKPGEWIITQ